MWQGRGDYSVLTGDHYAQGGSWSNRVTKDIVGNIPWPYTKNIGSLQSYKEWLPNLLEQLQGIVAWIGDAIESRT